MYIFAIVMGLFYVFAGVVALRMVHLGSLMDGMIEALDGTKVDRNERIKTATLTIGAYLTGASGAALVALSSLAPAVFIANTLVQGGYLVWASKALPPEDEDDKRGRQQTTNAFVLYTAATAFVLWLSYTSQLRAWPDDLTWQILEVAIPVVAALASRFSLNLNFKRSSASPATHSPVELTGDYAPPTNLRLAPEYHCWPLWDADTGENISHYHIDISIELAERIEAWDDSWQESYNADDPTLSGFSDPAKLEAYMSEGRAIALELRKAWPGTIDDKFFL